MGRWIGGFLIQLPLARDCPGCRREIKLPGRSRDGLFITSTLMEDRFDRFLDSAWGMGKLERGGKVELTHPTVVTDGMGGIHGGNGGALRR